MNNEEKILELLGQILEKQTTLDRNQAVTEKELKEIRWKFVELNTNGFKTTESLAVIERSQTKLEESLEFTKGVVIKIENEHGQKLESIYDGLDRHEAAINRIESKVDRIESKVDALDTAVGIHDIRLDKLAK